VQRALDAAAGTIPAADRQSSEFVLKSAVDLLRHAAEEYAEAVQGGRITNDAEYQDGLGFTMIARQSIDALEPQLRKRDADAFARLQEALSSLMKAWPSARPPAQATLAPSEVYAAVSRVELAAAPLWR